eukprot:5887623-Amphidinium_carterae.1
MLVVVVLVGCCCSGICWTSVSMASCDWTLTNVQEILCSECQQTMVNEVCRLHKDLGHWSRLIAVFAHAVEMQDQFMANELKRYCVTFIIKNFEAVLGASENRQLFSNLAQSEASRSSGFC